MLKVRKTHLMGKPMIEATVLCDKAPKIIAVRESRQDAIEAVMAMLDLLKRKPLRPC
jgi:hypothetical protein